MKQFEAEKAIAVLEKLIKALDREEPPSLINQDRVAALRVAIVALEHYPNYKTMDEV